MNTREKILEQLEKYKGEIVSGGRLAQEIGVSRNAVWKTITSLKADGYEIESVPNRGYRLSAHSDRLSKEAIVPFLMPGIDIDIHVLETTESTNKDCKKLALGEPERPAVVIANRQTKGRGRLGRTFYSPSDTGIYISFLLKPARDARDSILITTAASVAVSKAIEKVTGHDTQIKWVNDIYVDGKKVCGILTEAVTDFETGTISYLIPGIGINCSTKDFPADARNLAGSIGGDISRNELAAEVINQVMVMLPELENRSYITYYREHSMILGENINVFSAGDEKGFAARALDIDNNGGLIIELPDKSRKTLTTGEISVRLRKE